MPSSSQTASALTLWVVLNRAARSVEDPLRRQTEAHGLSLTEFAVLEVLLSKGALPLGDIAGRVLRASASVTYVVDKLEGRGLLRRRAGTEDRRVVYAELTADGRALIEPVFAEHAALIALLTSGLEPDEQEATTDLLRRLGLHAKALSAPAALAA